MNKQVYIAPMFNGIHMVATSMIASSVHIVTGNTNLEYAGDSDEAARVKGEASGSFWDE